MKEKAYQLVSLYLFNLIVSDFAAAVAWFAALYCSSTVLHTGENFLSQERLETDHSVPRNLHSQVDIQSFITVEPKGVRSSYLH